MDYSQKALDEMKEYADSDKGCMVQRMLAALGEQLDKPCGRCTASRYIDRMSGKNAGRPELRRMLEYVRRGDSPMKGRMPDDRAIAAGALDAFLTWFISNISRRRITSGGFTKKRLPKDAWTG